MRFLIKEWLEKTEWIFAAAIILPFILALNVKDFKFLIEASLGVVFFFSIRPFFMHKFVLRENLTGIINSNLINYVLHSGVYLLLATLFLASDGLWTGYLLLAIAPPAISIVPMCYLSKCDPEVADSAIFVGYLLSLIIIPTALFVMYGKTIDFMILAKVMLVLIIIPGLLSFAFRKSKSKIFSYGKAITNVCIGMAIFISISLNRGAFLDFSNPEIGYIYLINFIAIFVTGFIVYHAFKKKSGPERAINYGLYASQKNAGMSITIGLLLFIPITAIPAIVTMAMQFAFFIFFEKVILKYDV
jgi:predicted Na+-dependent transporter